MSERNKKTPWDEELEAQVLAEEQAKRKQANSEQLAAYSELNAAQQPKPASQPGDTDDSDIAGLLAEAEMPAPGPDKPTLDIEVGRSTFADENAAVKHFEHAFAPSGGADNLWTRLEDQFGEKELRIYVGTAVLILVVLLFSAWFSGLATRQLAARSAAMEKAKNSQAEMQENVDGAEAGAQDN